MDIFDYDNILLLPRQCRVESRADCDPSVEFGAALDPALARQQQDVVVVEDVHVGLLS